MIRLAYGKMSNFAGRTTKKGVRVQNKTCDKFTLIKRSLKSWMTYSSGISLKVFTSKSLYPLFITHLNSRHEAQLRDNLVFPSHLSIDPLGSAIF